MTPRPSLILSTVLDAVFRTALLFSLFLLFAGHNAPGGGFVGGLVAAAAIVLRFVAGGTAEVNRVVPVRGSVLLGTGLLTATVVGIGGLAWGDTFLESAVVEITVPLLATLKTTTALPFDVGVYLVVVGLVLTVVGSLGSDVDQEAGP